AGSPRTAGLRVGGRGTGRVPAERRRELHHRPDPRGRRGPLDPVRAGGGPGDPLPVARGRPYRWVPGVSRGMGGDRVRRTRKLAVVTVTLLALLGAAPM